MKLEDKELKIINHYGVEAQLDYFPTEIYELVEAVKDYDCVGCCYDDSEECQNIEKQLRKHVIEKFADCEMMLDQFELKFEYKGIKGVHICNDSLPNALKCLFKDVGIFIQKVAIHEYEGYCYDEPSEFLIAAMVNVKEKLNFIKRYFVINQKDIDFIKLEKADRQLSRIEEENSKR